MSSFMASQEARLSRFEADFKQQQSEMTNKLDNLLKAFTNQMLTPSNKDTRSTTSGPPTKDPSSSKNVHFVNIVTIKPITREEDDENKDDSDPKVETVESEVIENKEVDDVESEVEYFNRWPTSEEKEYHKDLFDSPETPYVLENDQSPGTCHFTILHRLGTLPGGDCKLLEIPREFLIVILCESLLVEFMAYGLYSVEFHYLVGDHPKAWDQKLPHAEFAHNHAVNHTTGFSPFHVVYGLSPRGPLDLLALPSKVRTHTTAEEFVDQLAQIAFLFTSIVKLDAKKVGPVEIVEKVNPNDYRLRLPNHIHIADIFNVKHLVPFAGDSSSEDDDVVPDSRSNLLYPGGNDAVQFGEEFIQKLDHPKLLRKCQNSKKA
ncbi:ribonuclease H-like domain-containing protein [Artemisia annua]|uniref:Ribonuclease H-like domain-containing protein n=1 Tax=Artemisia annua TaxID=35608 RepID=A0A2U1ME22_ARTAN|nr:ribonuclease H-like domain-containing protein [Artemisia annua]